MIDSIRETQKKYGSRAMAGAVVAALALVAVGQTSLGKGLVLGALFSVVNFVLMGETLPARLAATRRRAALRSLGLLGVRYLLLAVPLAAALKLEQFSLPATAAGLFAVQVVILGEHLAKALPPRRCKAP